MKNIFILCMIAVIGFAIGRIIGDIIIPDVDECTGNPNLIVCQEIWDLWTDSPSFHVEDN